MNHSTILESLSWEIDGAKILSDVSLTVEGGECFAVLGISGSGKSSLLRHVSKLEKGGSWYIGRGWASHDGPPTSRSAFRFSLD